MTMPSAPGRAIELPPPGYPMLVLLITDDLVPEDGAKKGTTVQWTVSKPHPFVPKMNVMRMFINNGAVEIYSTSADGAVGTRDTIPMIRVRLAQEAMPLDVFVQELAAAESGFDADDDDDGDEELPLIGGETMPSPPPPNGQTAS
jgi:hypothetical protein